MMRRVPVLLTLAALGAASWWLGYEIGAFIVSVTTH